MKRLFLIRLFVLVLILILRVPTMISPATASLFVPDENTTQRWMRPPVNSAPWVAGLIASTIERALRHPIEVGATAADATGQPFFRALIQRYQHYGVGEGLYPKALRGLLTGGIPRALSPPILVAVHGLYPQDSPDPQPFKSVTENVVGGLACGIVDAPFLDLLERERTLKLLPGTTMADYRRTRHLLFARTIVGCAILFGSMNTLQERYNAEHAFLKSTSFAIGTAYLTQAYAAPLESMRISMILNAQLSYTGALQKVIASGSALKTIKARGFGQAAGWVVFNLVSAQVLNLYGRVLSADDCYPDLP